MSEDGDLTGTWTSVFILAAAVALGLTPLLRRVAIAVEFVDHPGDRKSHKAPMPYLGGVAIILATTVGAAVGPFAGTRTALLIGGAAILGAIGLVDDKRHVGPYVRLGAEVALACAAYGFGVRAVATGIEALDALITVVWVAGITNACNFLDNMDGHTATIGLASGTSIFALGALGGQYRIATIGIALAAACLGFLALNFRPATIFMGDSGALFIGFLVAMLTLQVAPDLAPPASFLVPLLLVAVPILDTTTVVFGRLRHGLSPLQAGKDHLSHRLVTRGLSREQAVGLLFGAQLVLGLLGAAIGTGSVPLGPGAAAGVGMVGALAAFAVPGKMYRNRRRPLPRKLRAAMAAVGAAVVVCAVPAVIALIDVRGPLNLAANEAQAAVAAARAGDVETATAQFARAQTQFEVGEQKLSGPLRSLGLAVPGLSSNLRAARMLAASGSRLSEAGVTIARSANPEDVAVTNGAIDLAALRSLTEDLELAADVLASIVADVRSVNYPYLVPQVRRSVDRLEAELTRAERDAATALGAASIAPALLGGDGSRRYFLAVQNNAEARATGGFIGNFGEIVAEGGKLRVDRFGRIGELNPAPTAPDRTLDAGEDFAARYDRFDVDRTWQNVNVSPDLPTVARVIAELYPQSGGKPVDGVIAIDPLGLAALLQLTGPVTVAPWPEPITAENVVSVTLERAYDRFPVQEQRVEFLGDVSDTVVRAVTTGSLGSPAQIVRALAPAVRDGHLRMAVTEQEAAKVLRRIGLSGAVPRNDVDSLLLTTQNAAGNKLDVYFRRAIAYDLTVAPQDDGSLAVEGSAEVRLTNDLPDRSLPASVVGPYDPRYVAGENRTFLSLYSPLQFVGATLDGQTTPLESGRELGRNVYSSFVSVPAEEQRTLDVDLSGTLPSDDGWYRLDLVPQPAVLADAVTLSLRVPEGWRITGSQGDLVVAPGRRSASLTAELTAPTRVGVRVEREPERRLLQRLLRPQALE
jgi:UDP-N-acetylmuramyl pentapeptide phosphotransferase/UDP-N-acetylglucosamine-1-phosphate transferase